MDEDSLGACESGGNDVACGGEEGEEVGSAGGEVGVLDGVEVVGVEGGGGEGRGGEGEDVGDVVGEEGGEVEGGGKAVETGGLIIGPFREDERELGGGAP